MSTTVSGVEQLSQSDTYNDDRTEADVNDYIVIPDEVKIFVCRLCFSLKTSNFAVNFVESNSGRNRKSIGDCTKRSRIWSFVFDVKLSMICNFFYID